MMSSEIEWIEAGDATIDWHGAAKFAVQWEGQDIVHIDIDQETRKATVRLFDARFNSPTMFERMDVIDLTVLRCCWCGDHVVQVGDGYEDVSGSAVCGIHVDGCAACDDGEAHPHELHVEPLTSLEEAKS